MIINYNDYETGANIASCLNSKSFTSFLCNSLIWLMFKFMIHKNTNGYITGL